MNTKSLNTKIVYLVEFFNTPHISVIASNFNYCEFLALQYLASKGVSDRIRSIEARFQAVCE